MFFWRFLFHSLSCFLFSLSLFPCASLRPLPLSLSLIFPLPLLLRLLLPVPILLLILFYVILIPFSRFFSLFLALFSSFSSYLLCKILILFSRSLSLFFHFLFLFEIPILRFITSWFVIGSCVRPSPLSLRRARYCHFFLLPLPFMSVSPFHNSSFHR